MIRCSVHPDTLVKRGSICETCLAIRAGAEWDSKNENSRSQKEIDKESHRQFLNDSIREQKPRHHKARKDEEFGQDLRVQPMSTLGLDVVEEVEDDA